jgi:hypothetical protein
MLGRPYAAAGGLGGARYHQGGGVIVGGGGGTRPLPADGLHRRCAGEWPSISSLGSLVGVLPCSRLHL